ncbi:MAG TPA: hypothetical protein VFB25_14305 [Gaiellaceae bacterium]|nr:hypothetical protein [Gaiellaceae bacterium]
MKPVQVRHDEATLTWGVNRWVMIEVDGTELQRQVTSAPQLSALLVEMGVTGATADSLAKEFWRQRPSDAGLGSARSGESMWRGSGLRWWQALAVLAAAILIWIVVIWLR